MKLNKDHKILAVCSTTDYKNFTRRATIEAIRKMHPNLDVLLFNGVTSLFTPKNTHGNTTIYKHHTWLPEAIGRKWNLNWLERSMRSTLRKRFFRRYNTVFLSDPNQYHLLPYIEEQQLVYLIRDPNVLQTQANKEPEEKFLNRADLVLATSRNLAESYLPKYHGIQHSNIHYWPNCVDLSVWNMVNMTAQKKNKKKPVIGVAGNFGKKRTDYELLETVTTKLSNIDFVIAGKIDSDEQREFWNKLLEKKNVTYKGFIPHDKLPSEVATWKVGLVTDRIDEYASYMHHNKVYQYLAMGIPAVSLKIHDDYEPLSPYVQVAENAAGYSRAIEEVIERSSHITFKQGCRKLAEENSALKRAEVFLEFLNGIGDAAKETDISEH